MSENVQFGIVVALWTVLSFVLLEGFLERKFKWMPLNKFKEPIECQEDETVEQLESLDMNAMAPTEVVIGSEDQDDSG